MLDAAHAHGIGREAEEGGGAVRFGHLCKADCFVAAIGIDAGDQRHAVADLVAGLGHHPGLFVECAGVYFRRMAVDGNRRDAVYVCGERQVTPGFRPVEFEIRIEGGKRRGDHTMRVVVFKTGHIGSPEISPIMLLARPSINALAADAGVTAETSQLSRKGGRFPGRTPCRAHVRHRRWSCYPIRSCRRHSGSD